MSKTPLYAAWATMLKRCDNEKYARYNDYGGRGIKVCDRWYTFENFFADMGDRPEGKTLDREDNNGNYEPGNCKWSTLQEQCSNKRNNVVITFQGRTLILAQWSREIGIPASAIKRRIFRYGWDIKRALTTKTKE
jgi:hypothetical protein